VAARGRCHRACWRAHRPHYSVKGFQLNEGREQLGHVEDLGGGQCIESLLGGVPYLSRLDRHRAVGLAVLDKLDSVAGIGLGGLDCSRLGPQSLGLGLGFGKGRHDLLGRGPGGHVSILSVGVR
jgi:hypothetical protein